MSAPKLDDEAGRLAALGRYDILDTGIEDEFEQIVQLVQKVFDVPMAAVTLIDADRQWFKAKRGLGLAHTPRNIAFCHHTIAAADGLSVEDAEADPRFAGTAMVVGDPNIRSYLGAPLRTPDGYQVGALCIISNQTRRFSVADREILRRFSEIVVSQMEMRQLANHDSLTGTLTRRAFDQQAFECIEAFRRHRTVQAMVVLDIDHFKHINDAHGHGCGDNVLKAVAATLRDRLGPCAVIGRLGGEEFGVLLVDDEAADVLAVAEMLRAAVAATMVAGLPQITTSIGVATLAPGVTTVDDWLRIADAALYAAKAGGRNRVVSG
ncbi:MAG: sensor domain-containing diguanylate cyclase [Sandarakinorhabdus sp.]|nr:sensor domain-containing diguanylate cyclase [Sandarakinorhabdus sp.]